MHTTIYPVTRRRLNTSSLQLKLHPLIKHLHVIDHFHCLLLCLYTFTHLLYFILSILTLYIIYVTFKTPFTVTTSSGFPLIASTLVYLIALRSNYARNFILFDFYLSRFTVTPKQHIHSIHNPRSS